MTEHRYYVYVEDDPKSRDVMRLMMERIIKNCTITIFADGVDFMGRVKALEHAPDMFLLDIHMAPNDGFTLLKLLRADPAYAGVPIVALTASVMNEEVDQLRTAGFNGVIAKPISPATFPVLLKRLHAGEAVWTVTD